MVVCRLFLYLYGIGTQIKTTKDMIRTEYARTNHQTLLKWIMYVSFTIGISMGILGIVYCTIGFVRDEHFFIAGLCCTIFSVLNLTTLFAMIFLSDMVVDEDEGIIFSSSDKKNTIKIEQISYIRYERTKKGKIRGLFIHGPGFKSLAVRLTVPKAEALAGHLLRLNPGIEVRSA